MKITKLTTYRVAPRWMFLKIETDEGVSGWGEAACLSVLFLPGLYVALRRRLHRARLLRCDWIGALG